MPDPFNGYHYLRHLRRRWRFLLVALVAAGATSLGVSLLVPAKYTGRVTVVIEPPGGSDSRVATAVSPIYLESLKTYEHYASSDQLFEKAANRFHLRRAGDSVPIEKLKREVLRVALPRNTMVMEISAVHPDPQLAHSIALFIAQEAVKLNRETNLAADAELAGPAKQSLAAAAERLRAAQAKFRDARLRTPSPDALKDELGNLGPQAADVARARLSLQLSYRDPEARDRDLERNLASQAADLERQTASLQQTLARRTEEIEAAQAELKDATTAYEQAERRNEEMTAQAGFRGERLSLLDPGVVPEKPSSPNTPLNVVAALALGGVLSLFYLSLEYSFNEQRAAAMREERWERLKS